LEGDSIITAVGTTEHVPIMVVPVVAAVTVMLLGGSLGACHPSQSYGRHARPRLPYDWHGADRERFRRAYGTRSYLHSHASSVLVESLNMLSLLVKEAP
jgi:hypothetical protein